MYLSVKPMTQPFSHPIIRKATVDDAAALGTLHVAAWLAAYQGIVPFSVLERMTVEQRTDQFRDAIAHQLEETYVLQQDGAIAGFLTLGAARDADLDARVIGEIWGIYIAPDSWRQGLGSRLVQYAEKLLSDRNYQQIVLWVLAENRAARAFYECWGYAPDGTTKLIPWQPPATAMRYSKPISPSKVAE
jgi:ribosomal protein S18 acetylase RimI-like enzyme